MESSGILSSEPDSWRRSAALRAPRGSPDSEPSTRARRYRVLLPGFSTSALQFLSKHSRGHSKDASVAKNLEASAYEQRLITAEAAPPYTMGGTVGHQNFCERGSKHQRDGIPGSWCSGRHARKPTPEGVGIQSSPWAALLWCSPSQHIPRAEFTRGSSPS